MFILPRTTSYWGRAVNADSRKQMREDGAAVLRKAANSKPVTVAKEVFDKLLQSAENQIDMDAVQQRADEYIAKAQAMANDANFRAGFDETGQCIRPASLRLPRLLTKPRNDKSDPAEQIGGTYSTLFFARRAGFAGCAAYACGDRSPDRAAVRHLLILHRRDSHD